MAYQALLIDFLAARGQGISQQDALRLGLIGSLFRPPFVGLLLAVILARNQAAAQAQIGGGSSSGTVTIRNTPPFLGLTKAQSDSLAKALGLTVTNDPNPVGTVSAQDPAAGAALPGNLTLKLTFGGQAPVPAPPPPAPPR